MARQRQLFVLFSRYEEAVEASMDLRFLPPEIEGGLKDHQEDLRRLICVCSFETMSPLFNWKYRRAVSSLKLKLGAEGWQDLCSWYGQGAVDVRRIINGAVCES